MYKARGLKVPEVQGTFCAGFFFLPGSFTHAEICPCVASASGDLSFPELESTCNGQYMAARQSSVNLSLPFAFNTQPTTLSGCQLGL